MYTMSATIELVFYSFKIFGFGSFRKFRITLIGCRLDSSIFVQVIRSVGLYIILNRVHQFFMENRRVNDRVCYRFLVSKKR